MSKYIFVPTKERQKRWLDYYEKHRDPDDIFGEDFEKISKAFDEEELLKLHDLLHRDQRRVFYSHGQQIMHITIDPDI